MVTQRPHFLTEQLEELPSYVGEDRRRCERAAERSSSRSIDF